MQILQLILLVTVFSYYSDDSYIDMEVTVWHYYDSYDVGEVEFIETLLEIGFKIVKPGTLDQCTDNATHVIRIFAKRARDYLKKIWADRAKTFIENLDM